MTRHTARSVPVVVASALALGVALAGCADDPDPGPDAGTDVGGDAASLPSELVWEEAFDAAPFGAFMSVWGRTGSDVFTVGGQPKTSADPGDGVVFHFDGDTWAQVDVPTGPMLNWVHGVGETVFVAGEAGRVLTLVDGAAPTETTLATTAPLWGIWAAAEDDVWTVGGDARNRDGAPVIFHFDGSAWDEVAVPALDRDGVAALFKVWGAAHDDVWAVGMLGVILHYDGTDWTQVASGTGDDLVSLWGRASDDIVAAGGRSNGTVGRWDGTAWTFERLARVSGLNGSWMGSDGTVLSVGVGGRVLRIASGFEFDATSTPTTNPLHAVWSAEGGPSFAVGGTLLSNPPYAGDVLIAR
ncbi:MAG: hypothetical protein H6700_05970 [Myxococcales bacterium]|nr:hypothetical protein [Myxococcales bacterium]MCB9519395.1 hypothetical protein [Myxococcales bacterium]MCB9531294.1 hypothetical protein [Myxococcales bacterium]